MEEITFDLNTEHSVGLGDNLCLLSALATLPNPVNILVDDRWDTCDRLSLYKRIFRIPDSQLKIIRTKARLANFNNVGWPIKIFTEYYRPSHVDVNGQTLKTADNLSKKKCIAVACSADFKEGENNLWPFCRSRSWDYWGRVITHIKSMGYDVITVDHAYHDLENKIELLVKNCRAIISYEGGMAHLAHMLDLPCFIVDWKLPSPSTTLDNFHCEFVHMTDNVYILRKDEEILGWDHDTFAKHMFGLQNHRGNNRLVNGTAKFSFAGPGISGDVKVTSQGGIELLSAPPMFGPSKKVTQLLNKYYNQSSQNELT